MSADRLNSKGSIVLKSETFDTNTASGGGTTRVYTGSKAQCQAQKMVEQGFGATVTKLESTGDGNYQLTATYTWDTSQGGSSSPAINAHDLDIDIEQVDIYTSDVMRNQLYTSFGTWAGVNGAVTFIKARVAEIESNPPAAIATVEAEFSIYAGAQLALMLNLFRGIGLHKITTCNQEKCVYKRRITAASYNQVQAGFTGASQIWTTAEILAFENVPSLWWFQLPAGYQWAKVGPIVSTVAQQKTEISYYYVRIFKAWSGNHLKPITG